MKKQHEIEIKKMLSENIDKNASELLLKFEALINNPEVAVGYFDYKGRVIQLNASARRIFEVQGFPGEGDKMESLFPPEYAILMTDRLKSALKAKEFLVFEDQLILEKSEKYLWTQFSRIPGNSKESVLIQVLFKDLTQVYAEREKMVYEVAFNKSLSLLARESLRHEPDIDHICQIVARISRENSQSDFGLVALLDSETGELLQNYSSLAPPKERNHDPRGTNQSFNEWAKEMYRQPRLDKEAYYSNQPNKNPVLTNNNEVKFRPANLLVVPVLADSLFMGQIIVGDRINPYKDQDLENMQSVANLFALALLRNRKDLELLKAKKEAEESDRLKTAFLTNVSHEIRTPMNGILGFSELLMNSHNKPEKVQKYNTVIQQSGRQLLKIIDDILDISKITTQQLQLVPTQVNINNLVRELFDHFQTEINRLNKPIRLVFKLGLDDGMCNFPVDQFRLRQVLFNILHNALKFTTHGLIQFGYYLNKKQSIEFFVEDTGVGMDPADASVIFEPFRQLEDTINKQLGGTGLGLAIGKGIVDAMGGEIWFEPNKHDRGTTFYFSFPISEPGILSISENLEKVAKYSWKGKKILIVEDDDLNFEFLAEVILPAGASMHHERQGLSSIQWVIDHPDTDLILLDIRLPDAIGYDVAKAIKQLNSRIFIIAQTAYAMPGDREKAIRSGCNEYLPKPVNRNRLLLLMDQFLNKN